MSKTPTKRRPTDSALRFVSARTSASDAGRFIVHGGNAEVLEGTNPGDLVIIEFPDRVRAERWYASPAYQEILPLRTENSASTVLLVEGVERDHSATDVLR